MNKKLNEKFLEKRLSNFFSEDYTVLNQVKLSQKKIDMVIKNDLEIWAVEVKIKDWKGALRQANLNKLGCDKSYVAIWHKYLKPVLKQFNIFDELGIGLIVITKDFVPKIEWLAKNITNYNPIAYNCLANSFYE